MTCTICDTAMIYYNHEYFECPDCGSQFWPFVEAVSVSKVVRQEFEKGLECARTKDVSQGTMYKKAVKVAGGSKSRKKGSDKKQKLERPTPNELHNRLCGKPEKAIGFVNPKPPKEIC